MYIVLVVDDEQSDLELMRDILQDKSYTVLEAGNYSQAVEVFRKHGGQVDILITDIALPERNGCELAKHLLRLQPELGILFVSGFVGAEVCKQYNIPLSDFHFLSKPFMRKELAARVRKILHSSEKSPFAPGGLADDSQPFPHV